MADPLSTNDPVFGVASTENATETRINDLDALTDENISLDMNIPVDFPAETFKMSFEQVVNYIKEYVLNSQYLVGDIIIGTTEDTPASRGLTGVWAIVEGETALSGISENLENLGIISGDNLPTITVPEHSHTISHTHTRGTMNITGNFSTDLGGVVWLPVNGAGCFSKSGYVNNTFKPSGGYTAEDGYNTLNFTASNNWSGSTSSPSSTNSGNTGTSGATLSVKGRHLNVIFWIKTSL